MKIDLNGLWRAEIEGKEYALRFPGAIQSCAALGAAYPSEAMPNGYLGTAILEKTFEVSSLKGQTELVCKGVMPYAEVYLNGCRVGTVEYCQTAFRFPVTPAVRMGSNTLRLVLEEKNLELIGGMRFDVLNWSGIFDEVYMESFDLKIASPELAITADTVTFSVQTEGAERAELTVLDGERQTFCVEGTILDGKASFSVPMNGLARWSPDAPKLYTLWVTVYSGEAQETKCFQTGIRTLRCAQNRFYLNDAPLYLFGGGDEYFSPCISPITEKAIIRRRFAAMKELGFNFYRYHTHTPTQAELEVCDELGIFVSVEIPILSNFSRITDAEKGLEILRTYIRQTRLHPCILDYCLGNESIQLMVRMPQEQALARRGYEVIRAEAPEQLAIFGFGNQGERPELPCDFLTPHLWSQDFRWAYEGLTKIPWQYLTAPQDGRPCVAHEFGKYGVWPDDAEDGDMPPDGYRLRYTEQNDALFDGKLSAALRPAIIRNAKMLSLFCAATSLEAIRRQPEFSGFVYWTFFRMGLRCGGLCGDMGEIPEEAKRLLAAATAPLGIFTDRDFQDRTFSSGETARFRITVSNFGAEHVENAALALCLRSGDETLWTGSAENIGCARGEIAQKAERTIPMPAVCAETQMELRMELRKDGRALCRNSLTLWCYPSGKMDFDARLVCHLHEQAHAEMLESSVRAATPVWSWISMLLGCEIPEYGFVPSDEKLPEYLPAALRKGRPDALICDRIDDTARAFLRAGVPVLFLDSGEFPAEVYAGAKPEKAWFSCNTFFAPFRSSWEEGNCATVLEGSLLRGNAEESYADVRWYSAVEGARPLLREALLKRLPLADTQNVFRVFRRVKKRPKSKKEPVYFAEMQKKQLEDCVYYMDGRVEGTKTAVTSLRLFSDACGKELLRKTITWLTGAERTEDTICK